MSITPPTLNLQQVERVVFSRRDMLTNDLICCDVQMGEHFYTWHEEREDWPLLIERLGRLPGFRKNWLARLSQASLTVCEFVAFEHAQGSSRCAE